MLKSPPCFIPLPWQTNPALRQISQRAYQGTLAWFGRLTQSWALWLLVCRALGWCLLQQTHHQAWLSLIIGDNFFQFRFARVLNKYKQLTKKGVKKNIISTIEEYHHLVQIGCSLRQHQTLRTVSRMTASVHR